jgi:glycosyltransferase involved in cell wall biosynthesis
MHEIILVDGRSVDDTVAVARELRPDVRIVTQTRRGKGNALACGFAAATGDVIAMVDADGSADPGEIPRFVQALLDGADFAKGTRHIKGGGSTDFTWIRRTGNRMLGTIFNICYRRRYTDLCYGFNVFWTRCVPTLALNPAGTKVPSNGAMPWGDGFEVETLIHIRAAKAGLAVSEVPSFERSRIHGNSNLRAVADGLRVLRVIVTELRPARRRQANSTEMPFAPGRQLPDAAIKDGLRDTAPVAGE